MGSWTRSTSSWSWRRDSRPRTWTDSPSRAAVESRDHVITSVDNPRVKEVLRLRRSRERRQTGLFVVEGPREVERARAAGLRFRATFVAPELSPAAAAHPDAEQVSERVLRHMAYRTEPEGVIAVVESPTHELPSNATLVLVAVGVEKPGNLGAMARSAEAAGADALLVADGSFDPWNPNAVRASTGAVFTLPIVAVEPRRALRAVSSASRRRRWRGDPLHRRRPSRADRTDRRRARTTASIGGGKRPLRRQSRSRSGERAADSLNASAAAAVLLFEAVRQRT